MQSDFYLKKVLKYTCMLFTFVLLWSIKSYNASASSAEVSIQSSEKQVVKGDIVYVIITVNSSDTMSGFEGYFTYDSRVLQYITGGSVANGNDDKFQISDTGRESGVNTLKYSVKFVARKGRFYLDRTQTAVCGLQFGGFVKDVGIIRYIKYYGKKDCKGSKKA